MPYVKAFRLPGVRGPSQGQSRWHLQALPHSGTNEVLERQGISCLSDRWGRKVFMLQGSHSPDCTKKPAVHARTPLAVGTLRGRNAPGIDTQVNYHLRVRVQACQGQLAGDPGGRSKGGRGFWGARKRGRRKRLTGAVQTRRNGLARDLQLGSRQRHPRPTEGAF